MRKYYDITNMLNTNAEYMMLLGQRSNGKSYQAKKVCIEEALRGKKFIYLRRWKADIKQRDVTAYFEDMPVFRLTVGKWQHIRAINGNLYFVNLETDGTIKEKEEIGRYCALNEHERYKSQVFKGYGTILYEEFITDETYLVDEPRLLQQYVSTVARLDKIRVILVGNTLTRVCPYFNEWALEGVLRQKQGTIELYHYHEDDGEFVTIAVEYCENMNAKNTMFFGQSAKQIISGEWDVKEVPKLPREKDKYEKVYEILIQYQSFKFVLELLVEKEEGGVICFVYPHTKRRKIYRIISDEFSDLPNVTSRLDRTRRPEEIIRNLLILDKICFSDNLTGSDFKKVLNNMQIY